MAIKNIKSREKDAYTQESFEKNMAAKKTLVDKVNNNPNESRQSLASKVNVSKNNERVEEVIKPSNNDDMDNNDNSKKKKSKKLKKNSDSFFFKLSKIGQVMLVIYLIFFIIGVFLLGRYFLSKGEPIIGSRNEPVRIISNDQVNEVKDKLQSNITADDISVNYTAFRFIVIVDLKDGKTIKDAKKVNQQVLKVVDGIIPIAEYFSSQDKLNNDLFIYSTDVVPTNYDVTSKFILQTHKNSRMAKPKTHDILTARDEKSSQEVIDTMKGK